MASVLSVVIVGRVMFGGVVDHVSSKYSCLSRVFFSGDSAILKKCSRSSTCSEGQFEVQIKRISNPLK